MEFFETLLIHRDTGADFVTEPVSVLVRTGRGALQPGLGDMAHIGHGLWEYVPADCEIGPWKTVVLFVADGAITAMDQYAGTPGQPIIPVSLAGKTALSRTDFLEMTVGLTPREDYQFWLAQLLQADPIPLSDPIKTGLARAYPQLFK
jgi:hypothetical protein